MANLAALKVKILKSLDGYAKYPAFHQLLIVQQAGMDWAHYLDAYGSGWIYDAVGHDEEDGESPRGQQWGLVLVPEDFATQAVASFPAVCSRLTEAQAADFYDRRHAAKFPDEEIDAEVLAQIKAKQDLGLKLTLQQRRAIDPRDEERGIRPNRRKHFRSFCQDRGFTIVNG